MNVADELDDNIIGVLRKIEENLNFHCAARNHLADRHKRLKLTDPSIEKLEAEHRKKKKEDERTFKAKEEQRIAS